MMLRGTQHDKTQYLVLVTYWTAAFDLADILCRERSEIVSFACSEICPIC
mgnify:CR=1 FL=1